MNVHKEYKVDKAKLIATLKQNRERHISVFRAAQDTYRKLAIEKLSAALKAAESGEEITFPQLMKPRSFANEYDKAIGLLEMSLSDTTEITGTDYERFILDRWGWSNNFKMSNSSYVGAGLLRAMGWDKDEED